MSRRGWECLGCGEPVRGFWESVNHCDPNEIDTDTQPPAPAGMETPDAYICLECEATHSTIEAAKTCCNGLVDWADAHTDHGGFED